jgi:calcineurin-like phosphoesterase family protein
MMQIVIRFKGKDMLLVHIPDDAKNTPFKYIIHGHIHKTGTRTYEPVPKKKYFNVCCEFHRYKPILINQVLGELENA